MTKKYKWTHSKPLCRGNAVVQDGIQLPGPDPEANFIRQGDLFEPTEAELKAFPDRIEEIEAKEKQ